jgi:hypothetical protein
VSQTITSLEGFIRKIRAVQPAPDEELLYRGHSERKWQLVPSVLRQTQFANNEHRMLRELVASHPNEFSNDATTLEQLARAQHYSLPTRLLDTTWNPLVALYFSCNEAQGSPGGVVVFRVKKDHIKYYDSDMVSCVANLCHLRPEERAAIDFGIAQRPFNAQPSVDRLLQFIRVEKPYFRPRIIPDHLKSVLCVIPKRNNQRILVQSGAFLLFGMFGNLDIDHADGISVERIHVNGKHKAGILSELDRMSINETSLFPEIDRAAKHVRGRS